MATYSWKARIRLPGGRQQDVTVQAENQANARLMIESMYGRGCIISGPNQQR